MFHVFVVNIFFIIIDNPFALDTQFIVRKGNVIFVAISLFFVRPPPPQLGTNMQSSDLRSPI